MHTLIFPLRIRFSKHLMFWSLSSVEYLNICDLQKKAKKFLKKKAWWLRGVWGRGLNRWLVHRSLCHLRSNNENSNTLIFQRDNKGYFIHKVLWRGDGSLEYIIFCLEVPLLVLIAIRKSDVKGRTQVTKSTPKKNLFRFRQGKALTVFFYSGCPHQSSAGVHGSKLTWRSLRHARIGKNNIQLCLETRRLKEILTKFVCNDIWYM